MRRIIVIAVSLLLPGYAVFFGEVTALAQNSQIEPNQSIVDAARRSRELKANAAHPPRVITNDELDREHRKYAQEELNAGVPMQPEGELSNFNVEGTPKTNSQKAIISADSGSKNDRSEESAAEDAAIAELKGQLASAENALDLQQRELLLDQNTIYSNPKYTTTQTGKAQLDFAKLQIEQTRQEIDTLKGPLADLEWRRYRRMQAGRTEGGSSAANDETVPPSALVLPHP
jgi:hypothetical protein